MKEVIGDDNGHWDWRGQEGELWWLLDSKHANILLKESHAHKCTGSIMLTSWRSIENIHVCCLMTWWTPLSLASRIWSEQDTVLHFTSHEVSFSKAAWRSLCMRMFKPRMQWWVEATQSHQPACCCFPLSPTAPHIPPMDLWKALLSFTQLGVNREYQM